MNGLKDKRVTPCVMAEHIGLLVSIKALCLLLQNQNDKLGSQELEFSNSDESRNVIFKKLLSFNNIYYYYYFL